MFSKKKKKNNNSINNNCAENTVNASSRLEISKILYFLEGGLFLVIFPRIPTKNFQEKKYSGDLEQIEPR